MLGNNFFKKVCKTIKHLNSFRDAPRFNEMSTDDIIKYFDDEYDIKLGKLNPNVPEDKVQMEINKCNSYFMSAERQRKKFEFNMNLKYLGKLNHHLNYYDEYKKYLENNISKLKYATVEDVPENKAPMTYWDWEWKKYHKMN